MRNALIIAALGLIFIALFNSREERAMELCMKQHSFAVCHNSIYR